MNVLNLKYQQVTISNASFPIFFAYLDIIVEDAFKIFVGLTSADGYKTLLSHLGPDPKVRQLLLLLNN